MINKGAMFGLDARIALAIFGALSIISGAALYSAIQESRLVAIHQSLIEVAKAYESHYIDTGEHTSGCHLFMNDMPDPANNHSGWKGPYLSGSCNGSVMQYYDEKIYALLATNPNEVLSSNVFTGHSINSTAPGEMWVIGACASDDDCAAYYYGTIAKTKAKSITEVENQLNIIDKHIDDGDGKFAGKFRFYTGSGASYWWSYKIMPKP